MVTLRLRSICLDLPLSSPTCHAHTLPLYMSLIERFPLPLCSCSLSQVYLASDSTSSAAEAQQLIEAAGLRVMMDEVRTTIA